MANNIEIIVSVKNLAARSIKDVQQKFSNLSLTLKDNKKKAEDLRKKLNER